MSSYFEDTTLALKQNKEIRAMAKDPVCGMDVDPATAKHQAEQEGQTYYFCAPGCKKECQENPEECRKK